MSEANDRNWYVVHTYSGYEHKVKAALEERIRSLGKPELFGEILVPSEKVVELVKGKKKTSSRKFFPGYILVNMLLNEDTRITSYNVCYTKLLRAGTSDRTNKNCNHFKVPKIFCLVEFRERYL